MTWTWGHKDPSGPLEACQIGIHKLLFPYSSGLLMANNSTTLSYLSTQWFRGYLNLQEEHACSQSSLCRQQLMQLQMAKQQTEAIAVPLHKAGKTGDPTNYRHGSRSTILAYTTSSRSEQLSSTTRQAIRRYMHVSLISGKLSTQFRGTYYGRDCKI